MSEHLNFFELSIPRAQKLAEQINWEHVFDQYDILKPYFRILASQGLNPKRGSRHTHLAEKLSMILDLPFLQQPKYKDTFSLGLSEICRLSKYLKTKDAVNLAQKLIRCGADVNVKTKPTDKSCLQEAVRANPKLVQLLLESGADISEADIFSCEQEETVKLLLARGVSWKAVEASKLAWNLCHLKVPVLKTLVEAMVREGFDIRAARSYGKSMLHIAAAHVDAAVLNYLIPFFPSIDLPDDHGHTALMKASVQRADIAEPVLHLLLSNGASVLASDSVGKTALMWAIECTDKKEIIGELLKYKPDLQARDSMGNTALHYCAARREYLYLSHVIARMLMDAGAEVNATNSFGQTALMLLSVATPKAVEVLVQGGSTLEIRDEWGRDVYDYAESESHKWLKSYGSKKGSDSLSASHRGQERVSIQRSPKVLRQIEEATALRDEVIAKLTEWMPNKKSSKYPDDIWLNILLAAKLGSEGIAVSVVEVDTEEVDRTGSMLSGPFFVSKKYPMIKGGYPIVQLDLRLASAICNKALGDGLLQLWEPDRYEDPVVRVIPRDAVSTALMTPFSTGKLCDQDETAVGLYWNSDPAEGVVQVFNFYASSGFQTDNLQGSLDEVMRSYDKVKPPTSLLNLIQRFHASLAKSKDNSPEIQLFGSFQQIQYSHTQIGKHLLFTIPYGPSGSAEVFFDVGTRGQVKFSCESTVR